MEEAYIVDATFSKTDFTQAPLAKGEYEHCSFEQCNFSGSNLSAIKFISCTFTGCNVSMAKTVATVLQDVAFKDCKMLGFRLDACSDFALSVSFDGCILNHASCYAARLKGTRFQNTQLHEVDFTNCDLTNAVFYNCDLSGAAFDNTNLEGADLRAAYNYTIDPERNRLRKAKFSTHGLAGLLTKYGMIIE